MKACSLHVFIIPEIVTWLSSTYDVRGHKNVGNFRHFKNEFLCTQRPCKAEKFPNAGVKFCIASLDSLKLLYKKIVKTFRFDRFLVSEFGFCCQGASCSCVC